MSYTRSLIFTNEYDLFDDDHYRHWLDIFGDSFEFKGMTFEWNGDDAYTAECSAALIEGITANDLGEFLEEKGYILIALSDWDYATPLSLGDNPLWRGTSQDTYSYTHVAMNVAPENPGSGEDPEDPSDDPEQPGDNPDQPGDPSGEDPENPSGEPEQPGDESDSKLGLGLGLLGAMMLIILIVVLLRK